MDRISHWEIALGWDFLFWALRGRDFLFWGTTGRFPFRGLCWGGTSSVLGKTSGLGHCRGRDFLFRVLRGAALPVWGICREELPFWGSQVEGLPV